MPRTALRRVRPVCAAVCVTTLAGLSSLNCVPPSCKGVGSAKVYLHHGEKEDKIEVLVLHPKDLEEKKWSWALFGNELGCY